MNRRLSLVLLTALSALALPACKQGTMPSPDSNGGAAARNGVEEPERSSSGLAVAVGGQSRDRPNGEPAPHRFQPAPHSPHGFVTAGATPPLQQLPRLISRIDQCYRDEVQDSLGMAYGASGGGFGRGGGSSPRTKAGAPSGMGAMGSSSSKPSLNAPTAAEGGRGWTGAPAPTAPAKRRSSQDYAPQESSAQAAPAPAADAAYAPSTPPAREEARQAPRDGEQEQSRDDRARKDKAETEQAIASTEPSDVGQEAPRGYHDWGAALYLSNDDTMSLSSAQRVMYAIDHFLPLPAEHIRPHELLNYFTFDTTEPAAGDDFAIRPSLAQVSGKQDEYSLALSVTGPLVNRDSRRNVVLSLVVDRSGSMSAEGRMEYLKRGLLKMTHELKRGDIVNLTLFDHSVCSPIEGFVVGRDDERTLTRAINALAPRGSTDVHSGLTAGYSMADHAYQPSYSNRVVLITDALANTGVTDPGMMSMISQYYDSRKIRLSGVGVGREFNDELLDRLTERGRGAYVFLGSEAEVDAVFGARFVSLIETTANDVHFRLHLPPSLRMNVFYGEESSTVKEDVQAIHYSANTAQLFLSDVMVRGGQLRPEDEFMLSVEYENPSTGEKLEEQFAYTLGEAQHDARNVRKGHLVMAFIDGLAEMAARPSYYGASAGSWSDEGGYARCEEGRAELSRLSTDLAGDAEVTRVLGLWDKYCARFSRPSQAVRRVTARTDTPSRGPWPGATR